MHLRFLPAVALAAASCVRASFVRTDPAYQPAALAQPPFVFIDRLPAAPYESVGVIEVVAPAGTALGAVLQAAADKGREVGCDVVLERSLHRVTVAQPGPRFVAAQYRPVQPQPVPAYAPPPHSREFVCGVFADAASRLPRAPEPYAYDD